MAIPRPGTPVRGSQSGAPLMAIFDLLGRKWAMGIIWNLSNGPATFRTLQAACGTISPTILNSRLKDLREAKIITRSEAGYLLTQMGEELLQLLQPFGDWSIRWAAHISDDESIDWAKYQKVKNR